RGDWDLSRHGEYSGNDFTYTDKLSGEKFLPQIVETSGGVDRTFLFLLMDAYEEEDVEEIKKLRNKEIGESANLKTANDIRIVLKLRPDIAPYKVAVFPLMRNKEEIVVKAKSIYNGLKLKFMTAWDDNGNVGKRYRRQDEIGTPWCITVDYQTLEDGTVTVRDRDTMEQVRIRIDELAVYFDNMLMKY
ncbi:MAG: His/Gly/Thr/Pro-type tRNA ligase C-terminal domain-containing protein, partial [bacterium]